MNNNDDIVAGVAEPLSPPQVEYTDCGRIKHEYYCEYIYCDSRDRKLVPFKKDNNDFSLRMTHKGCWKCMKEHYKPDSELLKTNPLNPVYDKCKCLTNAKTPCKMKSNSEGFNKKFGYCKYHNFKKFHKIYN